MNDPITTEIKLDPGGIVVVGPRGRFRLHRHASGKVCVDFFNCDFVGPDDMSPAQKALVNERWALRSEDGVPIIAEILRHEQELAKGRTSGGSEGGGAKMAEGQPAVRSGGASDLPELRSQDDIDGSLPPGWWIAPCAALGIIFWGAVAWMIA